MNQHRHRKAMILLSVTMVAVAIGLVLGTVAVLQKPPSAAAGSEKLATSSLVSDDESGDDTPRRVRTIHPKRDTSFQVTVKQLATVEPFYQATDRKSVV